MQPPGNTGNGISIRHAGVPNWWELDNPNGQSRIDNLPGGAVVGSFGGSAEMVKWVTTYRIINSDPVSYTHLTLPTKA